MLLRRTAWLLTLVPLLVAGCGGGGSSNTAVAPVPTPTPTPTPNSNPTPTPTPTPAPVQHLYVGSDTSSGIARYALPLTASEVPAFTFASTGNSGIALDAAGDLAQGDNTGHVRFFSAPLSAASTPSASFADGGVSSIGQMAFSSAGDLYATGDNNVNVFTHPFTNASVPSLIHTGLASSYGIAFDAAAKLYVAGSTATGGSQIDVFAPPYTGAPTVVTPAIPGVTYGMVAISGNQLLVTSLGAAASQIDVYTLPLSAASAPAFAIGTPGITVEGLAADATGKVYASIFETGSVAVFAPPFSASSVTTTTLNVYGAHTFFSVAVGP